MAHLSQQVRVQLRNLTANGSYVSVAAGQDAEGRLLLATATSYGAVLVWDVEDERILTIVRTEPASLSVAMANDVDGQTLLATMSNRHPDHIIRLWDAHEGRLQLSVNAGWASVMALGADTSGRMLIAGSGTTDGLVRVWDGRTGQLARTLSGHVGVLGSPCLTPSGVSIATTSMPCARALAFSPRGGLLASGGEDGVRLWDPSDGRALGLLPAGTHGVESLAFGAPQQGPLILAAGGIDGLIWVWAVESGTLLHTLAGHGGRSVLVALGEDAEGRVLLGASGPDATISIRDSQHPAVQHVVEPRVSPPMIGSTLPAFLYTVHSWGLAFGTTSDGRLLLTSADGDGRARAYDASTSELRHTLVGSVPTARSVALGLDGAGGLLLVVGDDTGLLHRFDALTGETAGTIEIGTCNADRLAVGVDDQGRTVLASSSFSGVVQVWDLDSGASRWQLSGDYVHWTAVAMGRGSGGGLLLASAGSDGTVRTWDLRNGRRLHEQVRATLVWSVTVGPGAGGRTVLVTGDADGRVQVQDPVDLAVLDVLTGPRCRVLCLAIGADESGRPLVAAGDEAGRVWVWTLGSRRWGRAVTGHGHTGEVLSVTFCADGNGRVRIATVAEDQTLRVWNPATGAAVEVQQLAGATYSVAAGSAPDGRPLLAVALMTGEVTVWRWPPA